MEFNQDNIRRFLIDAIPSRFQHLSPDEFCSFIGYVFTADGYEVEELDKKGEPGHYLIAKKDDQSLIIKALRYPKEIAVNIDEIQKVTAARTFYETDQAWIITTSLFAPPAKKEADKVDIELWDWEAFHNALAQLFFEGKTYFQFVEQYGATYGEEVKTTEIKLKASWQPEEGIGTEWYNLGIVVTNASNRNVYIHLDLPALIDNNKNQVMADQWLENEFVAGMIYSGASVRTNALFKASRLGESPPGGRIIVTCHERTDPPSTYHLSARIKGSACYFVTHCYSRSSEEYRLMINFRDIRLSRNIAGRIIISCYYFISPTLVKLATKSVIFDIAIRFITDKAIGFIKKRYL